MEGLTNFSPYTSTPSDNATEFTEVCGNVVVLKLGVLGIVCRAGGCTFCSVMDTKAGWFHSSYRRHTIR